MNWFLSKMTQINKEPVKGERYELQKNLIYTITS